MFGYLFLGMTYAFAAAVQPGPFQSYLISQSLSRGWRHTLPAALAPLLSDGPIILLVLLVLSQVPVWLQNVLQLAGGVFLLYLAFGAWKTFRTYTSGTVAQQGGGRQQTLLKGALVNLLNPNPYLAWSLVMGPLLLKGWSETPANAIALLLGFYITLIATLVGIILLFSAASGLGPRVGRILVGASALALAAFGLFELWSGIRNALN
jgi:threonine/homoserine/homoserine lactone efflux protein